MQCFKKYQFKVPGSSPVASYVQRRAPCGNCPANVEMPVKLVEVVETVAVLGTAGHGAENTCGENIILQFAFRQNYNASKLCPVASNESFVSFLYINELYGKMFAFYSFQKCYLTSLKVHSCRYENLAIHSSLYKNRIMQIAHYKTFHFLRFAHFKSTKCLFTNIQKQQNTLKSSLLFKKNTNFTGK